MPLPQKNPITLGLIEKGIIPPQCSNFELRIPAGGVIKIVVETYIDEADFQKIADALMENPEAAREMTQYLLRSKDRGEGVLGPV